MTKGFSRFHADFYILFCFILFYFQTHFMLLTKPQGPELLQYRQPQEALHYCNSSFKCWICNVVFLSETRQIYRNNKGLFSTLNFVSIFHFILSFLAFYRPCICTVTRLFERFNKIKHSTFFSK